jgi:3',5'-cyclic AMP phosphodiesterase CpdA
VDERVAEDLHRDLLSLKPDLIVVSGDLTQRARGQEFKNAKAYLDQLPFPKVITPGNHDIPFYDVIRRFFFPLTRYKKYITANMSPLYQDNEIAVLGINTARSFTWKNGRISLDQIIDMKEKLCALPNSLIKIVVTHHPFIPPPGGAGIEMVGRAVKALDVIDECSVDLLLAGHVHDAYSGDIRTYYPTRKRSVVVAQAGTAISNRRRGEPNSYNLLLIDGARIEINERRWTDVGFCNTTTSVFANENEQWIKAE